MRSAGENNNGEGWRNHAYLAWDDPCDLDGRRNEDEKLVRDFARAFAQEYLLRHAGDYLDERFDREIMMRMGRGGLRGPATPQASPRRGRESLSPLLLFTNFNQEGGRR